MTIDNHAACYAAFQSKDSRFDGHFFVGVTSTGIYCRPVCRARLPRPENCTFFKTAAEAERAGFRPCLLCRPELAPGCAPMVPATRLRTCSAVPQTGTVCAPVDASHRLAVLAAKQLEEHCGSIESLEELAASLGHGPAPAPGVPGGVPCLTGGIPADLPPAAGQKPADRYRAFGSGGGHGLRFRKSAPV